MNREREFEDQLAALADKYRGVADSISEKDLTKEMLLDYYAGTLPTDQAQRVGQLAALSPWASEYLANLAMDDEAAAEAVDRLGFFEQIAQVFQWRTSPIRALLAAGGQQRVLTLAGGAAVAVLAFALFIPPMLDSPPRTGTYVVPGGLGKDVATLPGGAPLGRVAEDWPTYGPTGEVSNIKWFAWDAIDGADEYLFRLVGPEGTILIDELLTENHFKLPKDQRAALRRNAQHAWVVEAFAPGADDAFAATVQFFTLTE